MNALLQVEDLRLEYATPRGPLPAVDGISFRIEGEGEALGIIGESGSGKTSLALAMMRILPRNARISGGSVRLAGRELLALPEDVFRREVRWRGMAMVFQGAMHALNPVIRVGPQVAERLLADGQPKADAMRQAERLLERVGLPSGTASRYPHELSGGMKQRVMIAAALTHSPPLLILDEPTSALDVSIQAQIMNLLKELKSELGMSLLFITHDLALASDLCDYLCVAYAGQLRERASAEDLLGQARDPYAQRLLASIPTLHGETRPAFLPGAPPDLRDELPGCRFEPRCPFAFARCAAEPPDLLEVEAGHWARCWLYAEGGEGAAAMPLPAAEGHR